MHFVGRFPDFTLALRRPYEHHSVGYTEASLIDHTVGSVHMGLTVNQLDRDCVLEEHLHSYEEGFYILEGCVIVGINERAYRLGPGDFGVFKVGTPHAWRNASQGTVRWLGMSAPQPKRPEKERDTFFVKHPRMVTDVRSQHLGAHNKDLLGHFYPSEIPTTGEPQSALTGSPGVSLRSLVDENFGACHYRMLFVEYPPGASIGLHDHPFEETYFILSGEVYASLDGERYLAKAGDVIWTGVGCVHSFANVGSKPVRWLETSSPQPPKENVFRFVAEWQQTAKKMKK